MNKQYTFWKLLRAQWSWNNDKIGLWIDLGIGVLTAMVYIYLGVFVYKDTGLPVEGFDAVKIFFYVTMITAIYLSILYHTIKLILMTLICFIVYHLCKAKFSEESYYKEATLLYEEMLEWRK